MQRYGMACVFIAACFAATFARGQDDQFYRAGANQLVQKLIVIDPTAYKVKSLEPSETRVPAATFDVYCRLKTGTPNDERSGHYYIGAMDGEPIGFIKKEFVITWDTRFGLEPVLGDTTKHFTLYKDPSLATPFIKYVGEEGKIPDGARRFALIHGEAGDEDTFEVAVFTGAVETGGVRQKEQMAIRNLELEIVFVVASTYSMRNMIDAVREVVERTSAELRSNQNLQPLVHFGLVEYRDAPPKNEFAARTLCRLTDDFSVFESKLAALETPDSDQSKEDDWPDDVIAGLDSALNGVGWKMNSSKHVIVLGDCPAKDGLFEWTQETFRSSVDKSLEDILQEARPSGGSDAAQALGARSFHAVTNQHPELIDEMLAGPLKDLEPQVKENLRKLVEDPNLVASARTDAEGLIRSLTESLDGDADAAESIVRLIRNNEGRNLASKQLERQFRQLAANDQELDGLFLAIDTSGTPSDKDRAIDELVAVLTKAFEALEAARGGNVQRPEDNLETVGNIGNAIYQIVGTQGGGKPLGAVETGYASVRDENGRLVAKKKVMVFEEELDHIGSYFLVLHRGLSKMSSKESRQNVAEVLERLKSTIALGVSGEEEFDETTKLAELIETEFPLKTPALEVSARELAVMTTPAFEDWLGSLKAAHERAEAALDNEQEWTALNSDEKKVRYRFLDLSELP